MAMMARFPRREEWKQAESGDWVTLLCPISGMLKSIVKSDPIKFYNGLWTTQNTTKRHYHQPRQFGLMLNEIEVPAAANPYPFPINIPMVSHQVL